MAGKRLLITGGAGFLGYYLVHAALHFSNSVGRGQPIRLTVWDSFRQGRPSWLSALSGNPNTCRRGARSNPAAPRADADVRVDHSRCWHCLPALLSQASDADDRCQHKRAAQPAGVRRATADGAAPLEGFCFTLRARSTETRTPEAIPRERLTAVTFMHRAARLLR